MSYYSYFMDPNGRTVYYENGSNPYFNPPNPQGYTQSYASTPYHQYIRPSASDFPIHGTFMPPIAIDLPSHQPSYSERESTLHKTRMAAKKTFYTKSENLSAKKKNYSSNPTTVQKSFPGAQAATRKNKEKPSKQQPERLITLAHQAEVIEADPDFEIDPNLVNELGESNLHIAASNGNFEIVQKMLKANPNIGALTLEGKTALNYAISSYKKYINEDTLKCIQLLVKHGGYSASQDTNKTKELLFKEIFVLLNGALIPDAHAIDILIRTGADKKAMKELIDEKLEHYSKTMDHELWLHYSPVEKMLSDPCETASLHRRSPYDDAILARYFSSLNLEKSAEKVPNLDNSDLLRKQNDSFEPYPVAINSLEKHVPKKRRRKKENDHGGTPLHMAIPKGNLKAIEDLVKRGADIHALTFKGKTPISYAINNYKQHPGENSLKIVRLLVEYGGYGPAPEGSQKAEFAKQALSKEIFTQNDGNLFPHAYNIEILIKAGADEKAMKELVADKLMECRKKNSENVHLWPYFEAAIGKLADPMTHLAQRSSLPEESKLSGKTLVSKAVNTRFKTNNSDLLARQKSRKPFDVP